MIIPKKKVNILKIEIILKFFNPEYLNICISLLLKSFIKKNCVVNKKIKGNISKIIDGEFKRERSKVKFIPISISLKNSNSDNILRTKTRLNITTRT